MKIRIIAAILLLSAVISMLSCSIPGISYSGVVTEERDKASPVITEEPVNETSAVQTAIESIEFINPETSPYTGYYTEPDIDINFNGETVTVLHLNDHNRPEFEWKESMGDIVGDALYTRNINTEERLNVKFEWVGIPGSAAYVNDFANTALNYHASGFKTDIIAAYSTAAGLIMTKGLLTDINSIENSYIEDKPWWSLSAFEDCAVGDSVFLLTGDISTNLLHSMHTVFVNSDLAERYAEKDLYSLVKEGTWTVDKMLELSIGAYRDSDNNGTVSENDTFGFGSHTIYLEALYTGSGLRYTERGEGSEFIKLSNDINSAKTSELLLKLNGTEVINSSYIENKKAYESYAKGNMLFFLGRFYMLDGLYENSVRNVDFSYSILPVPKYDTEQEEYYTYTGSLFTFWCIPDMAKDEAMSSAVLQCLASEGYRNTTPAIFENNIKYRYVDAPNGLSAIFDLMRESVKLDLGLYTVSEINIASQFTESFKQYETVMKKRIETVNRDLSKIFN